MPKFNVHSSYFNHPKVQRLKLYCGDEADIFPIRLWGFCAEYFQDDGIMRGYTAPEIEKILGWKGGQGNLIDGLIRVGFLDKKSEFYAVHDWSEHAGFLKAYRINGKRNKNNLKQFTGIGTGHSGRPSGIKEKNIKEKNIKEYKDKDSKDLIAKDATPTTPQASFVLKFKETYEAMTGQPFNALQSHYVIASRLIKAHGLDAVILKVKTLGALCRDRSTWFTSGGWADFSIEKLSSRWNEIIPDVVPISKEEKAKREDEAIREKVREANERTKRALDS